jgi:metal-responsive CopG/Arc/MetJ family transcriptional regulator
LKYFYCPIGSTDNIGSTMQTAYVKTSVSIPADLFEYLKKKADANGGVPISRLVAQAIRHQAKKDSKQEAAK